MLVLTAKRDDRIRIGENIEILIIYTADSRVRIGIEAPRDLRIERKPRQPTGAKSSTSNETTDETTGVGPRESTSDENRPSENTPGEGAHGEISPGKVPPETSGARENPTDDPAEMKLTLRLQLTETGILSVEASDTDGADADARSGADVGFPAPSAKSDNPDSLRVAAPMQLVATPHPPTFNGRSQISPGLTTSDSASVPSTTIPAEPTLPHRPRGS